MSSTSEKAVISVELSAPSTSSGSLRPIIPDWSNRYSKSASVTLNTQTIAPGSFLFSREPEPGYLPPQWSSHIHPEGQLYFSRDTPLRVVTESHMYTAKTLSEVSAWVKHIEDLLCEEQIAITDSIELFVELNEDGCAYYLVDKAAHIVFWAKSVNTEDVGLPYSVSSSHLKLALENQYWNHIEHFPMHFGGLAPHYVDDLICTFSHGLADHLTSNVSTFEHSREDCETYLRLLPISKAHIHDGRQICLVARLLSTVARNRFNTHYGEQHSRLSRDQSIIEALPSGESRLLSMLSFRASEDFLARLNNVFIDRLVYVTEWRSFMSYCQADWRHSAQVAFAFLALHLFCLNLDTQPVSNGVSFALCLAGLISSVLLLYRYKGMEKSISSDGLQHLTSVLHDRHGFKYTAFLFALPSALSIWGISAFIVNSIYLIGVSFGSWPAVVVSAAICFALAAFVKAIDVDWRQWAAVPTSVAAYRQFIPGFLMRRSDKKDGYEIMV